MYCTNIVSGREELSSLQFGEGVNKVSFGVQFGVGANEVSFKNHL